MAESMNSERYDFITFLEVCQNLEIDFLPITWRPALDHLGIGAQSEVRQSLVNLALSFAFNRVNVSTSLSQEKESQIYQALISQVSILANSKIQSHLNINHLIGVCWDIIPEENNQNQEYIHPRRDGLPRDEIEIWQNISSCKWRVWPALVFEKSKHGDLNYFMRSASGLNLDIVGRLKLCAGIACGVQILHENRK